MCVIIVDVIICASLVPSPEMTMTVEKMNVLYNHVEYKMSFLIVFKRELGTDTR